MEKTQDFLVHIVQLGPSSNPKSKRQFWTKANTKFTLKPPTTTTTYFLYPNSPTYFLYPNPEHFSCSSKLRQKHYSCLYNFVTKRESMPVCTSIEHSRGSPTSKECLGIDIQEQHSLSLSQRIQIGQKSVFLPTPGKG